MAQLSVTFPELLSAIVRPTLLLDPVRVRRNIARMAAKARAERVRFRPHFKTHQSAAVGEWFRAEGVSAITVSSLLMARYFADAGWRDITVAFPVNLREMALINELAPQIRLHLLVESAATARQLAARLVAPVGIWLEIDTGYGRSGVEWNTAAELHEVATAVTDSGILELQGLLTHDGHTYSAGEPAAILRVHRQSVERLERARSWLAEYGFLGLEISVGDTPACSLADTFDDIDEIRPGNFVFYDQSQVSFGACQPEDVAMVVACPVVAIYPRRSELILYGGGVHLSKEQMPHAGGGAEYGRVVLFDAQGWGEPLDGVWLRSLSQEHGIIAAEPSAFARLATAVRVGDLVGVVPVHSCLAADLLKRYRTVDGQWLEMMRGW